MPWHNKSMETQLLIDALKMTLKSKGLNYAQLSQLLGTSERTVNRIFQKGSLSVDRLFHICNLLEVAPQDLIKMMEADYESREGEFTYEQEKFLSANFPYFLFYILLYQNKSAQKLAKDYSIDENTLIKMLAKLDELKLIEWLPGNEVKIIGSRKYISESGPISKTHVKRLATLLFENAMKDSKNPDLTQFLSLSKKAQLKYRSKLKEVIKDIRKDMEIERVLNIPSEPCGIYLGIRSLEFIYEELRGFRES